MKKLILATVMVFALSASVGVVAQETKAPAKKECCKKTAKKDGECKKDSKCTTKKDSNCTKGEKKQGCCKKG